MTAPTPEQLRALAARMDDEAGIYSLEREAVDALRAAADQITNMQRAYRELEDQRDRYVRRYSEQSDELRAAADQLEAVQEAWNKGYRAGKYDQLGWDGVYDTDNPYTTADTAPQEGRDE